MARVTVVIFSFTLCNGFRNHEDKEDEFQPASLRDSHVSSCMESNIAQKVLPHFSWLIEIRLFLSVSMRVFIVINVNAIGIMLNKFGLVNFEFGKLDHETDNTTDNWTSSPLKTLPFTFPNGEKMTVRNNGRARITYFIKIHYNHRRPLKFDNVDSKAPPESVDFPCHGCIERCTSVLSVCKRLWYTLWSYNRKSWMKAQAVHGNIEPI